MTTQDAMASAAEQLRAVLAEIGSGELTCSPGLRNRLEGAVLALDAVAGGEPAEVVAERLVNERLRDTRS